MTNLELERQPLVGREKECRIISDAIENRGTRVIFMEGIGGIGKTAILREIPEFVHNSGALCLPIIDFYDTRMHTHPAIEQAIAEALDPEGKRFEEYARVALTSGRTLKKHQEQVWQAFLAGYNRCAEQQHIILRFDTAERLENERDSDAVMHDCQVKPRDAPSWEWLLKRIAEFKNTTVIIASRPTPLSILRKRLLKAHPRQVHVVRLEGFTMAETLAYFEGVPFGQQVHKTAPEMVEKIHILAEGRPILTALALDWLRRGMWDPKIYPFPLDKLKELERRAAGEGKKGEHFRQLSEIRHIFQIALVQQIRNLDHGGQDAAILFAAIARKGCNPDLLARLMRIPLDRAEQVVSELLKLSFVKPPRGPRQLFFLHDEMYDLIEEHLWKTQWPDYAEQARLERDVIIPWYGEQIERLGDQIKACEPGPEQNAKRREQQLLQVERLYYQMDADPRMGYKEYSILSEQAIGAKEHDWDIWLRNEALAFTFHRAWRKGNPENAGVVEGYPVADPAAIVNGHPVRNESVDYDCRRRWVNRYIAQNETRRAVQIAEKLLKRERSKGEPQLYRGGIYIALAHAQALIGGDESLAALKNVARGFQLLKAVPKPHREEWLYPYLLARGYHARGVAQRSILQLSRAADSYAESARRFHEIGFQPGLAEVMNNLAYVYSKQGRLDQAMASCDEALRIRRKLGDDYSIGLSLNTRGIIYERLDDPAKAIKNSEEALQIFDQKEDERATILAKINLGRSYRRYGRDRDRGQKDENFQKADNYLRDALERQDKLEQNFDRFYSIELFNELGCLNRDWAATLVEAKHLEDARVPALLDEAEEYLIQSIDLCTRGDEVVTSHAVQYADSLEDLARVYYWRARLSLRVGRWGREIKERVPLDVMRCLLDDARHIAERGSSEWEELFFVLGKVYYQYARLLREQARTRHGAGSAKLFKDAAAYYAHAAGLIERYSPDAPELIKVVTDASEWLLGVEPAEAAQYITQMRRTLSRHKLKSHRLQEWTNRVVYPLLGVGWSGKEAGHE